MPVGAKLPRRLVGVPGASVAVPAHSGVGVGVAVEVAVGDGIGVGDGVESQEPVLLSTMVPWPRYSRVFPGELFVKVRQPSKVILAFSLKVITTALFTWLLMNLPLVMVIVVDVHARMRAEFTELSSMVTSCSVALTVEGTLPPSPRKIPSALRTVTLTRVTCVFTSRASIIDIPLEPTPLIVTLDIRNAAPSPHIDELLACRHVNGMAVTIDGETFAGYQVIAQLSQHRAIAGEGIGRAFCDI